MAGQAMIALAAPTLPQGVFEPGQRASVSQVVDGDTVVLATGRVVRLVGIQAPKLPLGREGFRPWPKSREAKAALEALVLTRSIQLNFAGNRQDRWDRMLAHLVLEDGTWVQGEMLRQGMARVYSFEDNRAGVKQLLEIEDEARVAERGIWSHPYYDVRTPSETLRLKDGFQIVEGVVVDAAKVKGQVFLNFDSDWRTDFTIRIPRVVLKDFEKQGHDVLSLEGRDVRVRGWIRQWNGPMIELTHTEQLEHVGH